MKALTISQPFAWLIARGIKTIENRTWFTSYRGELAIHAGGGRQYRDDFEEMRTQWWPEHGIPTWEAIPKGAIVALATLLDCKPFRKCDDPWAEGPVCWSLSDIRPLSEPMLFKGHQGIWDVPIASQPIIRDLARKAAS